jgi:hypothetical protein
MIDNIIGWIAQHQQAIFFIFMIIAPTVAIFTKKGPATAAVLAAVGAAAVLLTRLPDISDFELLALKVKLDRQSQQVEVTLQQLQNLSTAFAEASLEELIMSGQRLQSMPLPEKFRVRDQIIKNLQAIGVPQSEILKAQNVWIFQVCYGFLETLKFYTQQPRNMQQQPDVTSEINKLPQDAARQLPPPDTLRKWVASKGLNDAKINRLLDEYQSVWNTGSMIDPNVPP